MTTPITCPLCRERYVDVNVLFCPTCRDRSEPDVMERMRSDLQQYRMVLDARMADTKRFYLALRNGARAAGFQPVVGPCAVRIVAQRANYDGDTIAAYRLVESSLQGLAFDDETEVRSTQVTLLDDGNLLTVVEARAMLEEEIMGLGGVGR